MHGHDGRTLGQTAVLRVLPEAEVAIAVLTNSDRAGGFLVEVTAELVRELTGVAVPAPFGPPPVAVQVGSEELRRLTGVYERAALRVEAQLRDGALVLHEVEADELGTGPEEADIPLIPVTGTLFAGRSAQTGTWLPYRFLRLPDGADCLHAYGRVTPRVG